MTPDLAVDGVLHFRRFLREVECHVVRHAFAQIKTNEFESKRREGWIAKRGPAQGQDVRKNAGIGDAALVSFGRWNTGASHGELEAKMMQKKEETWRG